MNDAFHPAHSLRYVTGAEPGIEVPVTEISLQDSPNGEKNPPLQVYRTAGPGSDPVCGLPPLRAGWIAGRADTETYPGRRRGLLDDGRSAVRR
ncbi:phosphomethylpyrimidine synthase ThiC, partial [Arthrobacter sp. GCM10027362]